MTPVVQVRNLAKHYVMRGDDPQWVLRDLTFSVCEGEFLTIVGPSGSGKTTLLNVLAQVDVATAGEMWFQSERIPIDDADALTPGLSSRVGYVTQDDNLLPWRTVLENVLLPLEFQRQMTSETRSRACRLTRDVGLGGYEHYYPGELSGGMRKRVALIRTLVYDPPVILMDEPFGALDAETRAVLQEQLLQLWADRRKTVVFVTHDITEAVTLGTRTLVLTRPPARVRSAHPVALPFPRRPRMILTDPLFQRLYRDIRAELEAACDV